MKLWGGFRKENFHTNAESRKGQGERVCKRLQLTVFAILVKELEVKKR
jgi:hypothetical protein